MKVNDAARGKMLSLAGSWPGADAELRSVQGADSFPASKT